MLFFPNLFFFSQDQTILPVGFCILGIVRQQISEHLENLKDGQVEKGDHFYRIFLDSLVIYIGLPTKLGTYNTFPGKIAFF